MRLSFSGAYTLLAWPSRLVVSLAKSHCTWYDLDFWIGLLSTSTIPINHTNVFFVE